MNSAKPLDDLYIEWIGKLVGLTSTKNKARTYWGLLKQLYSTEFLYFVPNDDNRAWDGIDLRDDFYDQVPDAIFDQNWYDENCSMLEMMLGLARRADFLADQDTMEDGIGGWFWLFAKNVGLDQYTDNRINSGSLEEIKHITNTINNRLYSKNGEGGLFPNPKSRKNQRTQELWAQLNSYLLDQGYVDPTPDH